MQQFNYSIKDYLEKLFSPLNPIYFVIFSLLLIIFLLYLVIKYKVRPLNQNHELEKQTIELRNSKIMALFAELDPNPIIRINPSGEVIFFNDSARELTGIRKGSNILDIISDIDFSIKDLIDENMTIGKQEKIKGKFYIINFIGIKYLDIAQVYFNNVSKLKQYELQIRKKNIILKKLYNRLYDQLEEERYRIARELHDSIGQNLIVIQMYSRKLERYFENNHDIKREFEKIDQTMGQTVTDIRSIIYDLKPKLLEEMGLKSAVQGLCMDINQKLNIKYHLLIDQMNEGIDYNIKLTIYRIIQEAINNIVKHSEATEFSVQIFEDDENFKLIISDNGIGFVQNKLHKGFGLSNMKERIEHLNGKLKIESLPGHGTLLIFEIRKGYKND